MTFTKIPDGEMAHRSAAVRHLNAAAEELELLQSPDGARVASAIRELGCEVVLNGLQA